MRIDKLELRNFKKFPTFDLRLHRQFTLLIGGNGAGKTSLLDALSVALGVWLVDPPDSTLLNSRRSISPSEIRLEATQTGDRIQFREAEGGVLVKATGQIENQKDLVWEHKIKPGKKKATNAGAKDALEVVAEAYRRANAEQHVLLPVIAYYGAGRAWLPHHERPKSRSAASGRARRWAAFYDCLNERIRVADLGDWFHGEALAAVNRAGRFRAGYEVVRNAVLHCVPGADGMWFDGDRNEIVLSVDQEALIAEQRAICAYTGIGIDIHRSHIEHMIPQAHCIQGEGDVAYDNMVACFPGPDDGNVPFGAVFKANWPPLEEQHLFVPMLAGPLPQRPLATSLLI